MVKNKGPEKKQLFIRPEARYDNTPTHYGLADFVFLRKLNRDTRPQNGINNIYIIK